MNNFVFYNPTKLVFGRNTVEKIGEYLKKDKIKKVLLLAGGGSIKKNGVYEKVVRSLFEHSIEKVEVWGVRPNPVLSKVKEAIEIARKEKVDAILAVGGGSVIDSAKAVAAGTKYEGNVWDFYIGKIKVKEAIPLYTILTLSATGTEMNGNSVVTNEDTLEKYSFSSIHVYPKISIVDPEIQFTLPANQTVNGAVDAISHVMEYYFDGTSNTQLADRIDESIVKTLVETTEKLLKDPHDYEARANFALSTTLALNGISGLGHSGGDWSSHAIEHALSALNPDVAHGAGLAVVFPAWLTYVKDLISDKLAKFGVEVFGIEDGINALKEWYKKIGAPVNLRELGFEKNDIEKLTDIASKMAPMGRLKKLEREDIKKILEIAF
ncbi:butanol dehydrogenase [Thermosipho melanesiensis]|uniref:Iron-containing alcohol dehydrogenase n=2 Tax=Thermosipho melanesiensis TaxID=46541 RepID=A6LL67_THEM4|nr:iron-containing alcohol dehydrogenase [Thermosipho melanesiensis]ABR30668.1 iron-containing alcohol dehydrogenase [Thermosipho melanesiensis BI429]APT73800.1 butanol dehydrogenase [Thermosipho melanesiensis]OOC35739.1 butanol dehydrogenase [Thermosipho melanesiensis]OOC39038.1 butanol dehydrogenase [Thermosipho melanesiensis]OOC39186.1 butanol dehydrogenase [Thermosipho melanesiensis]